MTGLPSRTAAAINPFASHGVEGATIFDNRTEEETTLPCDAVLVNVAAYPEDFSFMVVVQFQAVTLDDLDALDEALNTFYAVGY